MRKILSMSSALPALGAVALAVLGAGVAQAAPRGGSFASLAMPLPAPKQEIVGGVLWKCAGEQCAAPSDGSRPLVLCQRVAKAFGEVTRFATPAGELSNEELSRCNGAS